MAKEHEKALLVLLLVVWAGTAAWTVLSVDEQARVPLVHVSGVPRGERVADNGTKEGLRINLDMLTANRAQRGATFTSPKNIFTLRPSQPVALPTVVPELPEHPPPTQEKVSLETGWDELARFRYLGYVKLADFGQKARTMALLEKDGVLHTVSSGETIDGRVLVKRITPREVTLLETEWQIEQRLPLDDRS